jgi:hypothetical protein
MYCTREFWLLSTVLRARISVYVGNQTQAALRVGIMQELTTICPRLRDSKVVWCPAAESQRDSFCRLDVWFPAQGLC